MRGFSRSPARSRFAISPEQTMPPQKSFRDRCETGKPRNGKGRTSEVAGRRWQRIRVWAILLGILSVPLNLSERWVLGQEVTETAGAPPRQQSRESLDFFERHIRPVLIEHCYACHSSEGGVVQGGLRLDSAEAMQRGGDSGALFEPGQLEESLLLSVLNWEQYEMPPSGKLPDATIEHFREWIEMGAPDPRQETDGQPPAAAIDSSRHWAFQAPQKHLPPRLAEADWGDWPIGPIDQFIGHSLQQLQLGFSPVAENQILLRRLHFVLTGLSPTFEQYSEFNSVDKDQLYQAYQQVVDRLLESPEFGERWGRHWLDVARYADTKGYVFQEDRNYYQAYRYRDWVIAAFNADLPYDQFIVAQLAAEQLEDPAARPAMGFLTLGRRFINNQQDIIDDRIDVMTRGLMGLTVSCARCHDHKYDPIGIDDYYSLYGVFASSYEPRPAEPKKTPPSEAGQDDGQEQGQEEGEPPFAAEDWLILKDSDTPSEPVVFLRGNPNLRGDPVPRQFPKILRTPDTPPFQQGSGRWEMARAIASPQNPLTVRVWVNRVWMHLLGKGLVNTPSDFGSRGDLPTHPELLDWLACRFVEEGWSTKWLIREVLLSRTFVQSSETTGAGLEIDPENRWLWRMNRRRLDWESLRDQLLQVSGDLDRSPGGPAIDLTAQPAVRRRTVYGFIDRQNLPGTFRTFDFASPDSHVAKRPDTVVPQQALFLMNSPFAMEQAVRLARQLEQAGSSELTDQVVLLFQKVLGRTPAFGELEEALAFLSALPETTSRLADVSVWSYGWGRYQPRRKQLEFQPLPHFTGTAWQGGSQLPDSQLGWVMLNAQGGHPGDRNRAAIRRWTAPAAGTLSVSGTLNHAAEQGDGVRCRLVSDRQGLLQEWTARQQTVNTTIEGVFIEPGEHLHFVTDCRSSESFDSFAWTLQLQLQRNSQVEDPPGREDGGMPSGQSAGILKWDSREGFGGPVSPPLNRWGQLAQVLLMTNEFMFVD
jgi:hypothetical protein